MLKNRLFTYCLFNLLVIPLLYSYEISASSKEIPQPPSNIPQESMVETMHQAFIGGEQISYKAVTGNLLIRDEKGVPQASFFFTSYHKDRREGEKPRPLTFCFNGGPGSSAVWLHLGLLGPQKVHLNERGEAIPPYEIVNNEFSLLDQTDLVFIDPISTGFSRAIPPEASKQYHQVDEDIKSVAEFIRLYTSRFNRWDAPKFLLGESYGTIRAVGLADYLHDHYYYYLNGVILISSVLDTQAVSFNAGNDLPYLTFLPTYTATAWYYNLLAPELQQNLQRTLGEVRRFVAEEYSVALFKGDRLSQEERQAIIKKLAFYTGLSPDYIERCNLRVSSCRFRKELLRDQKRTLGYFDSRVRGIEGDAAGGIVQYDPSFDAVLGVFTATMNHYVRNQLKWETDAHYQIMADVFPWKWEYNKSTNQYLNLIDTLSDVIMRQSHLKVFIAAGLFDLATPFFSTEYTVDHLGLEPSLRNHVILKEYEAGHMMYLERSILAKMKEDLSHYYQETLQGEEGKKKR